MNKEEKFRGNPVYYKSENGKLIITYDQFALDNKYKLYVKNCRDNIFYYGGSDNSLGNLIKYAKMHYQYNH